ncbi:MAG: DUF1772 domain-containing protein [Chitinophagaceae bacterium]|nr:DUF1772 domain-containing protein [Chitinophagaceae bacterium]
MVLLKILMLINLLVYSVIVGQAYMYIIALGNVQQSMDAPAYIQLRQLTDRNFMAKYKYVVYTSLVSSVLLCIFTAAHPTGFLFISAAVALLALITDVVLTLKGNMPINKRINTWATEKYPGNWETYRTKWLRTFSFRQAANIIGFTSLLLGAIFGT